MENGAVAQRLVRTGHRVLENRLRQLDFGKPAIQGLDLLLGLITPIVRKRALRRENLADLAQRKACQLE